MHTNTLRYLILGIIIALGGFFVVYDRMNNNDRDPQQAQESQAHPCKINEEFCIVSNPLHQPLTVNTSTEYTFFIANAQGGTQRTFVPTHTKLMHILVVRKDLAYFQHLHPTYNEETGSFTIPNLTFPTNGAYRIFADFALAEQPLTLYEDVTIGSNMNDEPIGSQERTKTFGDYTVTLVTHDNIIQSGTEETIRFNISKNDTPVTDLQAYLGARGHSVILREETLDFIHTHPQEKETQDGSVEFKATFPQPGTYKLFTQFQHQGEILLTDFVLPVTQGTLAPAKTPIMNHSVHE